MWTTQECYMVFEHILEAALHKTAAVQLQTPHLANCSKVGWKSKDEFRSEVLSWTPTHGHTSDGLPAKTYSSVQTFDDV